MTIPERLVEIRERNGYTRKRLAEELGRPYRTITNYENGEREPGHDYIIEIATKFGVSSDYILGLTDTSALPNNKKAPSDLSEEALHVAKDYEGLDRHGRNMTKIVITEEQKRMVEERRRRETGEAEPQGTRIIPLYYTPAAAGMASPAVGEDFDYIEISNDAPRNADFAVKIDGDSMEPYIMDGSIVYVNREPLENGDVGIFYVDGDMLCKQYYKDDAGNVRLLSLNRARHDADRFISARGDDTVLTYYGRVILPRRPLISWA